jgi:phage terminase large subunit-like protein
MEMDKRLTVVPPEKLKKMLERAEALKQQRAAENKLSDYLPYEKQREFHRAGATHRERLMMAGNQLGKTLGGAMETAMHATGQYPPWWEGWRVDRPTVGWVAGTSGETVRDTVQRMLVGRQQDGTGAIPKSAIVELTPARGIPDLLDSIRVRHESGAISTIGLKSYLRGRESFQGETLDYLWLDEEPPPDVYFEALTRTNVSQGPIWLTFTPLTGISDVVKRYLMEPSPDRHVTTMTIDDVTHFSDADRARIIDGYPEHERECRTRGVPTMGSGRIFTTAEEKLLVEPFEIPSHWLRWGGCDFGWTHYSAFVELAWDRDLDVIYLVQTLRLREQTPLQHAEAIRSWNLTWAWPCDGRQTSLPGAGVPLMEQYAAAGLDMMHEHAQFADGSRAIEAGLMEMADRMRGGRWKVFRGQNDGWLEEYRLYHRDVDGRIVDKHDDAISASRYGLMMRRHAHTSGWKREFYAPINYPRPSLV